MPELKKKTVLKKKPLVTKKKEEELIDDDVVDQEEETVVETPKPKPSKKLLKKTQKSVEEDDDDFEEEKPKKPVKNSKVEEDDEEEEENEVLEEEIEEEEELEAEDEETTLEEVESEEDDEEEVVVEKPKPKKSSTKTKNTSKSNKASTKSKPTSKTKLKKALEITYPENGQLTRDNLITAVYNLVTDEDYDETDPKEVARHIVNRYVGKTGIVKDKITKRDVAAMILCLEEVVTTALSHNCRIRLFNGLFKTKQIEAKVYSGALIQERMDKGNGDDTLTFAYTRATWFTKLNLPEQSSVKGRIIREKTNKKPGQFRIKGSKDVINF